MQDPCSEASEAFECTAHYTIEHSRRLTWYLWKHYSSRDALIGTIAMAFAIVAFFFHVYIGWGLLIIAAGFLLVSFSEYSRFARGFAQSRRFSRAETVQWRFTKTRLRYHTDLFATELDWRLVQQIVRLPHVWIFFTKGGHSVVFPLDNASPDLQAFINERFEQARPKKS